MAGKNGTDGIEGLNSESMGEVSTVGGGEDGHGDEGYRREESLFGSRIWSIQVRGGGGFDDSRQRNVVDG